MSQKLQFQGKGGGGEEWGENAELFPCQVTSTENVWSGRIEIFLNNVRLYINIF